MKNLISFSLWGSDPKYTIGAIRNVELAKYIYPEFKCRFYVAADVPVGVVIQLEDLGAEIVYVGELGGFSGMFWRMRAINDADVVLIRDCDSRLEVREREYVDMWLKSDYLFHTIKDHPAHIPFEVMPGLMGLKRSKIDWDGLVTTFLQNKNCNHFGYGIDYMFYSWCKSVYEGDILIHNALYDKRVGLEFCGKVWDENEKTVQEHERTLEQYLRGRK